MNPLEMQAGHYWFRMQYRNHATEEATWDNWEVVRVDDRQHINGAGWGMTLERLLKNKSQQNLEVEYCEISSPGEPIGFFATIEKARRIYYQDIVYAVCNRLDREFLQSKTVAGTLEEPSTEVIERLDEMMERLVKYRFENRGQE